MRIMNQVPSSGHFRVARTVRGVLLQQKPTGRLSAGLKKPPATAISVDLGFKKTDGAIAIDTLVAATRRPPAGTKR